MKLAHYTTAAHLGLILRAGVLEASVHEGFKNKCVSFVLLEAQPPTFFWDNRSERTQDPFADRRRARIIVDLPSTIVQDWADACTSRKLVKLTKEREPISDWRVVSRDILASEFVAVEYLCDNGAWARVSLEVLETMMAGRRYGLFNVSTGMTRDAIY